MIPQSTRFKELQSGKHIIFRGQNILTPQDTCSGAWDSSKTPPFTYISSLDSICILNCIFSIE